VVQFKVPEWIGGSFLVLSDCE